MLGYKQHWTSLTLIVWTKTHWHFQNIQISTIWLWVDNRIVILIQLNLMYQYSNNIDFILLRRFYYYFLPKNTKLYQLFLEMYAHWTLCIVCIDAYGGGLWLTVSHPLTTVLFVPHCFLPIVLEYKDNPVKFLLSHWRNGSNWWGTLRTHKADSPFVKVSKRINKRQVVHVGTLASHIHTT